jgi:hypothetical protein
LHTPVTSLSATGLSAAGLSVTPSLDSRIASLTKESLSLSKPTNTKEKLRKKLVNEDLKKYRELKTFIHPIIENIKQYVNWNQVTNPNQVPNPNQVTNVSPSVHNVIMEQLELRLITLDDQINYEYCNIVAHLIKLYIVSFPTVVWKSWIDKIILPSSHHYLIYIRFWSMFSQILNNAAKQSQTHFLNMSDSQKKEIVIQIKDVPSFYNYIKNSELSISPIDVLHAILEAKRLFYVEDRDLFINIYSKGCPTFDEIITICSAQTRSTCILRRWLLFAKNEESFFRPIMDYCLKYRRSYIQDPTFLNPITFCKENKVPIVDYDLCKSTKETKIERTKMPKITKIAPLVADLKNPFMFKNHKIVAVCVVNMMYFHDTDISLFDRVRQFEKLYIGKIAVICNLGVIQSPDYKGDIVFLDRQQLLSYAKR